MKIYKTKWFRKWAAREGLANAVLQRAVRELEMGLGDALAVTNGLAYDGCHYCKDVDILCNQETHQHDELGFASVEGIAGLRTRPGQGSQSL